MNELHLYWCGWNVPFGLPLDDLAEKWHPRMTGWCTGESDTYATYTGAVWATSPDAAMAIVRSNYGKHAARIDHGQRGTVPRARCVRRRTGSSVAERRNLGLLRAMSRREDRSRS